MLTFNRAKLRLLRSVATAISAAALMLSGAPCFAMEKPLNCPLKDEPLSTSSPLLDLLLSPTATDVLNRHGYLKNIPAFFTPTAPPTFASIITFRQLPTTKGILATDLDILDGELKQIKLDASFKRLRCSRYDDIRPPIPEFGPGPKILVFGKINGFKDEPSVSAASQALRQIAARNGWNLFFSENAGIFNQDDLRKFDAVLWNNVSGDVLTVEQRVAFKAYIENGGGFVGIHGAGGDPAYFWDWYVKTLVGAQFAGHPLNPHFQAAYVVVDDKASPITSEVSPGWTMTEEWYSFVESPRASGAHILLTLDESTYNPPKEMVMGDHPIAWQKCIGKGRSFYTAIGHRPESYSEPHAMSVLERGIGWAISPNSLAKEDEPTCH